MKKKSKSNGFNMFACLMSDPRKRKKLREVLKQHGKTVDDYARLYKKDKFL